MSEYGKVERPFLHSSLVGLVKRQVMKPAPHPSEYITGFIAAVAVVAVEIS